MLLMEELGSKIFFGGGGGGGGGSGFSGGFRVAPRFRLEDNCGPGPR